MNDYLTNIGAVEIAWVSIASFVILFIISFFVNRNATITQKSEILVQFALNLFTMASLLVFMSKNPLSADIILALLIASLYSFNKMVECCSNAFKPAHPNLESEREALISAIASKEKEIRELKEKI